MKTISVLGSTGAIGRKTVSVLLEDLSKYKVELLVANTNFELLAEQAKLLSSKRVIICDERFYGALKALLSDTEIDVSCGYHSLLEACSINVDYAMVAIVGIVALKPIMKLIESRVRILALANKESIVCMGNLLLDAAAVNNVKIIPVDSEHNAVFQILENGNQSNIRTITLTASGGPFLHNTLEEIRRVTISDALNHPVWQMGAKILVDSATMTNKSLEVIEAYYLFRLSAEKIDVIIHPESIIHAMVSYSDGNIFSIMSVPDMIVPIRYTLFWPYRMSCNSQILNLVAKSKLTFLEPDYRKFPALNLGFEVLKSSKVEVNSIILNAANEVAVGSFLLSKIKFIDIVKVIYSTLENVVFEKIDSLESVLECDRVSRTHAEKIISNFY